MKMAEHLPYTIRNLERMGFCYCDRDKLIESNSLFKINLRQSKISKIFQKIKIAVSRKSKDFLIVARIESFILARFK